MNTFNQYFEIRKRDDGSRMVWGYASTECVDSQGETVTRQAIIEAWDDYMKFANIREMHQLSAVGVVKEYEFDDLGVMIGAHIVDDNAWNKVINEVYKGFSIGGKKKPGSYDASTKTINGITLMEISLVDRPANPEALITMWKSGGIGMEGEAETSYKKLTLFKALKGMDVRKGMWEVVDLVDLVQRLKWLYESTQMETQWEGDGSLIPQDLAAALEGLCAILLRMVQEECAELLPVIPEANSVVMLADTMSALPASAEIQKQLNVLNVIKAEARNSEADATMIQQAHDLMMELGAVCASQEDDVEEAETGSDTKKTEPAVDHTEEPIVVKADIPVEVDHIQKMNEMIEKVTSEMADLRKRNEELQSLYDNLPRAPKSVLKTVSKEADSSDPLGGFVPVLKSDGSLDPVATQIKYIHSQKGNG